MKFELGSKGRAAFIAPILMGMATAGADAFEIQIDYSLDANGFFNQPGSREALRAVCDYFESIISDDLARIDPAEWPGQSWTAKVIDPATGGTVNFPGKVIPADTLILYAGGRNLGSPTGQGGPAFFSASGSGASSQAWFNLLNSRGQSGALASPPTDFASWGGSISFNTTRTWNFSLTTQNGNTSFIPTALHELCHFLGIGTVDSWDTYVTAGGFTGPNAVASYGGNVPLQVGGGHWRDDERCVSPNGYEPGNPLNVLSRTIGQFGVTAGQTQIARMDPSACAIGTSFLVMTELDEAGLADVGWQVRVATPFVPDIPLLAASRNPANGHITLSWTAVPSQTYQVQEAAALAGWMNLGAAISGQSGAAQYTDTDPPAGKNFYRLEITQTAPAASPSAQSSRDLGYREISVSPRIANGCTDCGGGH